MKKFKIGDIVRLRKDSKFWGQSGDTEGEVVNFFTSHTHALYIYVEWNDGKMYHYGEQDLDLVETIQKAEEATKFKVGDIVKLREDSEHAHQSDGKNGVITELEHGEYRYRITWANGKSNIYRAIDICLVKAFESLVDKYIMVTDVEDGHAYFQVISDGEFDNDGSQYAKVIGVNFDKTVHTTPINFMIKNNYERAYCFIIPQRVAWLNRVLKKSTYINFADWSETMSEEDKLIIECLQRYPNLKIGEKFGFSDHADRIVREIHPRNWTVRSSFSYGYEIYLAKYGEGGAKVYSNKQWAERTSVTLAPPPEVIYYNSTAPSTEIFIPSPTEKMIITSDGKVDYGVVEDSSSFKLIIDQPIEKTPLLNKKSKIKQLKLN